jgi:hypothetical protein
MSLTYGKRQIFGLLFTNELNGLKGHSHGNLLRILYNITKIIFFHLLKSNFPT